MRVLFLFLLSLFLLPARDDRDREFRLFLADAIVSVTDDAIEQETLMRLARYEAGYRRNVARCEKKGDNGKSKGEFQVQPMSAADAKDACGTLPEQAALALRYLRRSAEICTKNTGAAAYNLYMSGRCDRGEAAAKLRWGGTPFPPLFHPIPTPPSTLPSALLPAAEEPATLDP